MLFKDKRMLICIIPWIVLAVLILYAVPDAMIQFEVGS